jgi:CPA1 family monovalent cation:H+ antiporter
LGVVLGAEGWQIFAILAALTIARFAWVFGSELAIKMGNAIGFERDKPLGVHGATVLSWAGVRGVVTLALALSVPDGFPGRDFILVTSFAVILFTVLFQGTTLARVIQWAHLTEPAADMPHLNLNQAEAAMAKAQLTTVQKLAYDEAGKLVHPLLLERYERRARAIIDYVERVESMRPLLHAHFDVVLEAVATGRRELIRLHRAGEIDDETLHELERDLDLEELSAISAKA